MEAEKARKRFLKFENIGKRSSTKKNVKFFWKVNNDKKIKRKIPGEISWMFYIIGKILQLRKITNKIFEKLKNGETNYSKNALKFWEV